MNAFEIVDLLLEADNFNSAIYVFGPDLPVTGYAALSVENAIERFKYYGIVDPAAKNDAETMNQLVKAGYTFLIKKYPGEIAAIGKVPVKTTEEGEELASKFLGLDRHTTVQYRRTPDSTSRELDADYVLYGSKEVEKERKEKRAVQTKGFGAIDPKAEGFDLPATGEGYKDPEDMMPLNAPLELGLTFDRQQKDGIHVLEVHRGGPAAQAGIRAGDVILQAASYTRNDGKPAKSYMLELPAHLEYVLRTADPRYAIPFRVIRGDGEYWLPVLAKEKSASAPAAASPTISAAEARAATGETSKGAYPAPRAKQMPLGLRQPKTGTTQRRLPLKYAPNQPRPARETGNPPANVSALT